MGFFSDLADDFKDLSTTQQIIDPGGHTGSTLPDFRASVEEAGGSGSNVGLFFDPADLSGEAGARRAEEASLEAEGLQQQSLVDAIAEERRAREEAQGFLTPFGDVGLGGVEQAGFLTDPQAQFDFLQNNPLFNLALENANRQTQQSAAARNRLSAGDTLEQLSNNVLLSAQPLIAGQKRSIADLLSFGGGIATTQANTAIGQGTNVGNLITTQGDVAASGIAGRQQISADAAQGRRELGGQALRLFVGGA